MPGHDKKPPEPTLAPHDDDDDDHDTNATEILRFVPQSELEVDPTDGKAARISPIVKK